MSTAIHDLSTITIELDPERMTLGAIVDLEECGTSALKLMQWLKQYTDTPVEVYRNIHLSMGEEFQAKLQAILKEIASQKK